MSLQPLITVPSSSGSIDHTSANDQATGGLLSLVVGGGAERAAQDPPVGCENQRGNGHVQTKSLEVLNEKGQCLFPGNRVLQLVPSAMFNWLKSLPGPWSWHFGS